METFTYSECSDWLADRHIEHTVGDDWGLYASVEISDSAYVSSLVIPPTGIRRAILARRLARWLNGSDVLLWVTSVAPYQKEVMDHFMSVTRYADLSHDVFDRPGTLVGADDDGRIMRIAQILFLIMDFDCVGIAVQASGRSKLWLVDEMLRTETQSERRCREMKAISRRLSLQEATAETVPWHFL